MCIQYKLKHIQIYRQILNKTNKFYRIHILHLFQRLLFSYSKRISLDFVCTSYFLSFFCRFVPIHCIFQSIYNVFVHNPIARAMDKKYNEQQFFLLCLLSFFWQNNEWKLENLNEHNKNRNKRQQQKKRNHNPNIYIFSFHHNHFFQLGIIQLCCLHTYQIMCIRMYYTNCV